LSVADGPEYEALGLSLRGMVHKLFKNHFEEELEIFQNEHDKLISTARKTMLQLLDCEPPVEEQPVSLAWYKRLFSPGTKSKIPASMGVEDHDTIIDRKIECAIADEDYLMRACGRALQTIINAFRGKQGFLPRDSEMLVEAAIILFSNSYGAEQIRSSMTEQFFRAAEMEGFTRLPVQREPVVFNVKGASAAGKSTIRPQQRELAQRLGIPWDTFALVSPDYWRKYLLDYESLDADHKYGAMLTGRELEIIDRKLDEYMAQKAEAGAMSHLLIDRFRFDSFSISDRSGSGSNLLSRFGERIFLFFMITPPEETVERAWKRGLSTGRYKAVDDLLYHNVEAYTGMPQLFFSWALSDKKVHWEFLDNDVSLGTQPRCAAFGWNDEMIVLDISVLANIDKFRDINIEATAPEEVHKKSLHKHSFDFLLQCTDRLSVLSFANFESSEICAQMKNGKWLWCDHDYIEMLDDQIDLKAGFKALGWSRQCAPNEVSKPISNRNDTAKYMLGNKV
ncbi:MAG: hypothetical protein AAF217_10110, partial [Pseudomonadota bacterium]